MNTTITSAIGSPKHHYKRTYLDSSIQQGRKFYVRHKDDSYELMFSPVCDKETEITVHLLKTNSSSHPYINIYGWDIGDKIKAEYLHDRIRLTDASADEAEKFCRDRNMHPLGYVSKDGHVSLGLFSNTVFSDRCAEVYLYSYPKQYIVVHPCGHSDLPLKGDLMHMFGCGYAHDMKNIAYQLSPSDMKNKYFHLQMTWCKNFCVPGKTVPIYEEDGNVIIEADPVICDNCGKEMSTRFDEPVVFTLCENEV